MSTATEQKKPRAKTPCACSGSGSFHRPCLLHYGLMPHVEQLSILGRLISYGRRTV